MDKSTFDVLVDKKLVTKVDLVEFYQSNPEKMAELSVDEAIKMGIVTEISSNSYILPDFSKGGTIVLDRDLMLTAPIVIEQDTEIVLNGHNIINDVMFVDESDGSTNCYVFWVKKGKLVIKGEGEVKAIAGSSYDMAVWANGGAVEIYGGHFISGGSENDGSDCLYASAGGKIDIYGGKFECLNINIKNYSKPQYAVLNEKDNNRNTIHCYGGTYVNFNPSDNVSEEKGHDFCAEGYQSVLIESGLWEVIKKEPGA